jgi:ATP-binding cassette subfamily B protein
LDAHSEREFYNNLIATIKDKTLILVTHRLSAIKLADYVYFLENGAILEEGTHKDLISLKKKYFYLYNLQAKSFEIDL